MVASRAGAVANGGNITRGPTIQRLPACSCCWRPMDGHRQQRAQDLRRKRMVVGRRRRWWWIHCRLFSSDSAFAAHRRQHVVRHHKWTAEDLYLWCLAAATVQWVPAQNNVFIQNNAPSSGWFFEGDIGPWLATCGTTPQMAYCFHPKQALWPMYLACT